MFSGREMSDWQSLTSESHMTAMRVSSSGLLDACSTHSATYGNATLSSFNIGGMQRAVLVGHDGLWSHVRPGEERAPVATRARAPM
jgi:hypothetical protein